MSSGTVTRTWVFTLPNLDFLDRSSQKYPISYPEGPALIHANRRTNGQTNSLIPFRSKRALVLGFNVARNNETYWGLHVKCPIFLPNSNHTSIFLTHFSNSPLSNFMEICPLRDALIHADGRTDRQFYRGMYVTKGRGAFRDHSNAHKYCICGKNVSKF
jgi:hypothetical protein